jgi:5'-nucleotidase
MNILLTNDDGYDAPGLHAAHNALSRLGAVHVVAPKTERSACSHMITLRRPIKVEVLTHSDFGPIYAVEGTPADCVRLGVAELIDQPIDLIVAGINRGANAGVDVFYSGTVAGAREGAILGITSIALSCAVRAEFEIDWNAAGSIAAITVDELIREKLPAPGFWNVNFPTPIPADARSSVHRVPLATQPTPMKFDRIERDDGRVMEFGYGAPYWTRDVPSPTDYSVLRDGGIAITAVPLAGVF